MAHYHFQRIQCRKSRRPTHDREERPIIQGLWVQEVDWLKSAEGETMSSADIIPPPPQFTDSTSAPEFYDGCSCMDACDMNLTEGGGGSDSDCGLDHDSVCTHDSESDSSCAADDGLPESSNLTLDLMHVSSSHFERWASLHSTFTSSDVNTAPGAFGFDDISGTDAVVEVLRGRVTQMPKLSASTFFSCLIKQTLSEWTGSKPLNEGLIFHQVRYRPTLYCKHTAYMILLAVISKTEKTHQNYIQTKVQIRNSDGNVMTLKQIKVDTIFPIMQLIASKVLSHIT